MDGQTGTKFTLVKILPSRTSACGLISVSALSFYEENKKWPADANELKAYMRSQSIGVDEEVFDQIDLSVTPEGGLSLVHSEYFIIDPDGNRVQVSKDDARNPAKAEIKIVTYPPTRP